MRSLQQWHPVPREMERAAPRRVGVGEGADAIRGTGPHRHQRAVELHQCVEVAGRVTGLHPLCVQHIGRQVQEITAGHAVPQCGTDAYPELSLAMRCSQRSERCLVEMADPQRQGWWQVGKPRLDLATAGRIVTGERQVQPETLHRQPRRGHGADEIRQLGGADPVPTHAAGELDNHAAPPTGERRNMGEAADGEHWVVVGGWGQRRRQYQRGQPIGHIVQFVHRADADSAALDRDLGDVGDVGSQAVQHGPTEAVAVAFHHGHQARAVPSGDRVHVRLPLGAVNGETYGHVVVTVAPLTGPGGIGGVNSELSDQICRYIIASMNSRLFGFPNPVNETSARLVAAGVVAQGAVFLVFRQWWLLVPLVYGFLARVLSGPRFSPLGQFVTRVVTPSLQVQHQFVAGPPKRFAQGVGLVFSGGALVVWAAGASSVSAVLITVLVVAATLESAFAFCLGCMVFNRLMRWGIIPDDVCAECNDLSRRLAAASS